MKLENLCREYKELKIMLEDTQAELDHIAELIRAEMGPNESMAVGPYKLTYKLITSSRLDSAALKQELPDVANRYTKETSYRRLNIR